MRVTFQKANWVQEETQERINTAFDILFEEILEKLKAERLEKGTHGYSS